MAAMEEKHVSLEKQVYDLQQAIARTNNPGEEPDVSENSNTGYEFTSYVFTYLYIYKFILCCLYFM